MSEKPESFENLSKWWSEAENRRAYTYKEKKLNRLNDYDLFLEVFSVELDEQKIRDFLEDGKFMSERKLKRIKRISENRINREHYEEEMDSGEGVFAYMIGLRNELPFLSSSEAYALAIHSIDSCLSDDADSKEKPTPIEEITAKLIEAMMLDWRHYMDNIPKAVERIGKLTDEYRANKRRQS